MDPLFPGVGSFLGEGHQFVVPSYDPDGWQRQDALLKHDGIYQALGLHPWCLPGLDKPKKLVTNAFNQWASKWGNRLVAVGEFGLDRARGDCKECFPLQEEIFRLHLEFAEKYQLPVIVHSVRAHGRTLELLQQAQPTAGGVLHSYSGPPEMVTSFLDTGMYLGISPALKSSEKLQRSLKAIPPERLLFESDSPAGSEPPLQRLQEVVRLAAEILDKSEEWCWSIQHTNCEKLFGITTI